MMDKVRGNGPYRDDRIGLIQRMVELEAENIRLRGIIHRGLFWRRRWLRRKFSGLTQGVRRWVANSLGPSLAVIAALAVITGVEVATLTIWREAAVRQSSCRSVQSAPATASEGPTVLISPPLLVFGRLETTSQLSRFRACPSDAAICPSDVITLPPTCWIEWADCDLTLPVRVEEATSR